MGRLPTFLLLAILVVVTAPVFGFAGDFTAPGINPLGDMAGYTSTEFVRNTSTEMEIDVDGGTQLREISGDIWYLRAEGRGDQDTVRKQFKDYVESIGAQILRWTKNAAVVRKDEANGIVWWCKARLESGMELAVVKTQRIDPGKPLTFEMGGDGRTETTFFADIPGGKFRSLVLTANQGEFTVTAEQIIRSGAYKRTINGKWYADTSRAKRFAWDTIPQEAGLCAFTLSTNADTSSTQVTIELVEHPIAIPIIETGEKLGALRIKNIPYGLAKIITSDWFGVIYTEHPEFPGGTGFENGDVTPEGDAYFLLPAGFWQVEVGPTKQNKASAIRANLVPVHSGKETLLDWPLAMTSVFGNDDGSGLIINNVKKHGNESDVTFSLYGQDAENITPKANELTLKEGGVKANILSVKRTSIPLDVVLLVDSSGSMKGQMRNALAATTSFIETLPDDAKVRLIDFDTKPKKLPGTDKASALKALNSIKANGATSLNDSVILGLQMLAGNQRPALVVFTDGFDANHNDTGPGSKATKEEVLAAAKESGVPVFTIGFGKKHDVDTLDRIASLSGGQYYAASDPQALDKTFAAISSTLSNIFTARYERPSRGRPSDVPVVTAVVDISGSMDTTPDKDGCDYRIDRVKTILHDFYTDLPENTLGQIMSFEDDIFMDQVTTSNRGALLCALSGLHAGGGTQIGLAVNSALETQSAIPSSKRYMVFITDAALEVDGEEKTFFETKLAKLKDEGIYSLWVGIGALDDAPFKKAAELSGGHYILTESPDELNTAFQDLIADIKTPTTRTGDVKTMVELTLKHRESSGRNLTFANARQATLPAPKMDKTVEVPASISCEMTTLKERYEPEVAALVTGDSVPVRDSKISKRIPINITGQNEAAAFTIKEAYFMNRLRGINPPSTSRYLVLTTEMKNILPKQKVTVYPDGTHHPASWVGNAEATRGKEVEMVPTYVIPDLKRHLFLRWNNETMTPISPATWLTESPLIMPGENAVAIPPGPSVTGAIAFTVPNGTMKQLSLHYYDTNYGHTDIPLVGTIPPGVNRTSDLPTKPPVQLSDAFSLAIREVKDTKKIGAHEAGDGSVYRIVEADFISNVQALLNLDPKQRFSLRLRTNEGALSVRLHNVTGLTPLGFLAPTMLSPGSNNRIRLVFRVPKEVAKEAGLGELVVDVKGGGGVIPLDEQAARAPVVQPPSSAMKGDGISMVVNSLKRSANDENVFIADLTLFDAKDGESTAMSNAFILKKKGFKEPEGVENEIAIPDYGKSKGLAGFATGNAIIPIGTMPPDSATDDLVFGITEDTIVPDGGSLRGLIVFKLPYGDTEPDDWQLTSSLFPKLNQALDTSIYDQSNLMVARSDVYYDFNETYLSELNEAVAKLKHQRESRRFKRPGYYEPKVLDGDGNKPAAFSVAVPEATDPALLDFAKINDIQTLKKRLAKIRFLPSNGLEWQHLYSPQAVLTQGWGSEGDFARMAEIVLARQGITTKRITMAVTDSGRKKLASMAGLSEGSLESLPALLYHNAKGTRHILVAPFLESANHLSDAVGRIISDEVDSADMVATLTVSLLAKPKQGGQGKAGRDLSDALSGETNAEDIERIYLLTANPTLPELSRGAVDIGYTVIGQQNGPVVTAVFDGNDKRTIGSERVDTGEYEVVGERIEIAMNSSNLVFERMFEEGETVVDRFHTLGLNLPDMTMASAKRLDSTLKKIHDAKAAPDNLSALKWYSRNLVYKFVCAQTEYERDLAGRMKLIVGRTLKPRCIIVTVSRPAKGGKVRTSVDLRQIANRIHPTSAATAQARHGFNIMTGIFASKLEADILPEGSMGFFEMLPYYPPDTEFLWLTSDARYNMEEELRAAMPDNVYKLLADSSSTVLFPSQPALVNGKQRWAWLEVSPDTYETIAVLDTGERGAMVERVFGELWKDGLDYITGGLVGVSSSIWAVSAYSLIMDDYKQILAAAKKFALGLADNFSATVKVGDFEFKGSVGSKDIETGYKGKGSGAIDAAKNAKSMYDKIKDPKVDLGGFEGGFKDGVNYYFSQAGG